MLFIKTGIYTDRVPVFQGIRAFGRKSDYDGPDDGRDLTGKLLTMYKFVKNVLENRKKLSMTEVKSVDGFTEQLLNVSLKDVKVKITGENIKISAYNKDSGNLVAEGNFKEIRYIVKSGPLIKKVFK